MNPADAFALGTFGVVVAALGWMLWTTRPGRKARRTGGVNAPAAGTNGNARKVR